MTTPGLEPDKVDLALWAYIQAAEKEILRQSFEVAAAEGHVPAAEGYLDRVMAAHSLRLVADGWLEDDKLVYRGTIVGMTRAGLRLYANFCRERRRLRDVAGLTSEAPP